MPNGAGEVGGNEMMQRRMQWLAYWALVAVTVFQAASAVAGGVAMLVTDGLGMPAAWLAGGPFVTFTIPGVILLLAVGGTQSIAAVLLILRRESALLSCAVAGFGMIIWIFVEVAMIVAVSWLQVIYFVTP
jgi:hypothetical protein